MAKQKRKKNQVLKIAVVALGGYALYKIWEKNQQSDTKFEESISQPVTPNQTTNQTTPNQTTNNATSWNEINPASNTPFPLVKGMGGKYVKALQVGLNRDFNANLSTDGKFGTNTHNAVVRFLDPLFNDKPNLKPSFVGVSWALFLQRGYDKLVQ